MPTQSLLESIMADTFCAYPWNHNYIHTNGKVRLCCTTIQDIPSNNQYTVFDAGKHSIEDYWNSDRMREIRRTLMAGEKVKDCARCYEQESQGIKSLRDPDRADFIKNTAPDGTYHPQAKTMQIQMGNICNLKCKMCSQMYSHMNGLELKEMGQRNPRWLHWVKEQGANVNNWTNELGVKQEWYKNKNLKYKMFKHISDHIEQLNVIGGEPTLIPEFYELFEYCDNQGTLGNKEVTIVTNLTNTNARLTKWLPKLSSWKIWASVDGLHERTEYIRYPSKWEKINESLDFYKSIMNDNGNITLSPAVQLLNIDQLDEMVHWWKTWCGGEFNEKFGWTWLATVWYPLICNPNTAPKEWRHRVADKLSKYKFDKFYDSLVDNLRKDYHTDEKAKQLQKAFIRYNDEQDKFRNVAITWRQLLPDLELALTKNIG
jgi:MoaA/NifB/PqqE/SkfB family radical SAM enzyme